VVQRLDRALLWTNFAFLLLTTMVPFTTNLVSFHSNLSIAVALYAANLLLLCAVLWVHIRHLCRHKHLATAELTGSLARSIERRLALFCVVTAAAIASRRPLPAGA
jgi:uncharacterized membrane protein